MDYAFILDPLPDLKAYKDSSVAMMRSLAERGHRIYALKQSDIFWDARGTQARAAPLTLHSDEHDWYSAGAPEERALKDFAAVVMRKDPPFDMEYVYSTYLLEAAERARVSSTTRVRFGITTRRLRSPGSRSSSPRRSSRAMPPGSTRSSMRTGIRSSNRSTAWAGRRYSAFEKTIRTAT